MPTFITIGYGDQDGYDRTDPAVRDAAHAHDERLRAAGVRMGVAGPPVQVRNPDGAGAEVRDGAFLTSALPIGGFAVIEAASMAEAIELASGTPCAVAHGVVEVWPLRDTP
ncbi:YciI family protein [Micromonospora sp. NBC_01392]|uniref:YciI family protein n=1 Tax=Micromonospora sp. NBC_01392 TaxID=2903588 RepID=UPI00324DC36F